MIPTGSYLQGNFVVTAADQSRAVLRPRLANGDSDPAVRIMVEYPNGAVAPREGAVLNRDLTIPYEIRDVRRGATGEITIYAREIIQQ